MFGTLIRLLPASLAVSFRQAAVLSSPSFRFLLTKDTLGVRLVVDHCDDNPHDGLSPSRYMPCPAHQKTKNSSAFFVSFITKDFNFFIHPPSSQTIRYGTFGPIDIIETRDFTHEKIINHSDTCHSFISLRLFLKCTGTR